MVIINLPVMDKSYSGESENCCITRQFNLNALVSYRCFTNDEIENGDRFVLADFNGKEWKVVMTKEDFEKVIKPQA